LEEAGSKYAELTTDTPLMDAGLNSMAAIRLSARLRSEVGIDLAPTFAFDHPTPHAMAMHFRTLGLTGPLGAPASIVALIEEELASMLDGAVGASLPNTVAGHATSTILPTEVVEQQLYAMIREDRDFAQRCRLALDAWPSVPSESLGRRLGGSVGTRILEAAAGWCHAMMMLIAGTWTVILVQIMIYAAWMCGNHAGFVKGQRTTIRHRRAASGALMPRYHFETIFLSLPSGLVPSIVSATFPLTGLRSTSEQELVDGLREGLIAALQDPCYRFLAGHHSPLRGGYVDSNSGIPFTIMRSRSVPAGTSPGYAARVARDVRTSIGISAGLEPLLAIVLHCFEDNPNVAWLTVHVTHALMDGGMLWRFLSEWARCCRLREQGGAWQETATLTSAADKRVLGTSAQRYMHWLEIEPAGGVVKHTAVCSLLSALSVLVEPIDLASRLLGKLPVYCAGQMTFSLPAELTAVVTKTGGSVTPTSAMIAHLLMVLWKLHAEAQPSAASSDIVVVLALDPRHFLSEYDDAFGQLACRGCCFWVRGIDQVGLPGVAAQVQKAVFAKLENRAHWEEMLSLVTLPELTQVPPEFRGAPQFNINAQQAKSLDFGAAGRMGSPVSNATVQVATIWMDLPGNTTISLGNSTLQSLRKSLLGRVAVTQDRVRTALETIPCLPASGDVPPPDAKADHVAALSKKAQ